MLAFGTSDFLQGLAILGDLAVTKGTPDDLPALLALVDAEYHPALHSYLEGCKCFDHVQAGLSGPLCGSSFQPENQR